jgi:hypothetical protein
MSEQSQRMSADEIFEPVTSSAREEIHRKPVGLAISGLAAGMTMGLTALGVASLLSAFGEGKAQQFLAALRRDWQRIQLRSNDGAHWRLYEAPRERNFPPLIAIRYLRS